MRLIMPKPNLILNKGARRNSTFTLSLLSRGSESCTSHPVPFTQPSFSTQLRHSDKHIPKGCKRKVNPPTLWCHGRLHLPRMQRHMQPSPPRRLQEPNSWRQARNLASFTCVSRLEFPSLPGVGARIAGSRLFYQADLPHWWLQIEGELPSCVCSSREC